MKKKLSIVIIACLSLAILSCSSKKETASSVAQKWCDLNGKAYRAPEGAGKEAAKATLDKYESEMEAKYKDNKAFMDEVEKEVNKCEDASEGRK